MTPENTSRPMRKRASLIALLLLLVLPFSMVAGCNPFTQPPAVADSIEQAFKDGEAKEADARQAESTNDKSEATDRWTKTATYYGAVARKFQGSDNGLRAVIKQAEALEKGAHNNQAALPILKAGVHQYDPQTAPTVYPQAQQAYKELIERIDLDNSKTTQYKVMDALVHMLGGDPKISPVLAVLFIAVAVTVGLWPLRRWQYRSFREMQRYQPQLASLQKKYKDNPQELMAKQQALYKEHGINPYAGCFPMLLQFPVTIFMYQIILYYQFHFTQTTFLWINPSSHLASLGFPGPLKGVLGSSLGEPDLIMLVIYAISMFLQTKLMPTQPTTDPMQAEQQKMMSYTMPVVFFVMMLQWQPASAFVLYWFVSNVLGLGQQWLIYRTLPPVIPLSVVSKDDDGSGAVEASEQKPMAANPKLVSPKNRKKK